MMLWWDGGHMSAAGWIGMIVMIVFWVAVLVGVVFLVRYLATRPGGGSGQSPGSPAPGQGGSEALRILEERYARGEIDREEFLTRKADLTS